MPPLRFLLFPLSLSVLATAALACGTDSAEGPRPIRVAVAGNFTAPLAELAQRFTARTAVPIEPSVGATGQLYTQILHGAPFDVFLAADDTRPALLEAGDHTVPGSRFCYAVGQLVLLVPGRDTVLDPEAELRTGTITTLAIAQPRTAPYGAAARDALGRWGLWDALQTSVVRGENVSQAFQFVESGAAQAGLVALSQVVRRDPHEYHLVSDTVYGPIRQEAVLLRHGADHPGARAFLAFLRGEEALRVIADFGYRAP